MRDIDSNSKKLPKQRVWRILRFCRRMLNEIVAILSLVLEKLIVIIQLLLVIVIVLFFAALFFFGASLFGVQISDGVASDFGEQLFQIFAILVGLLGAIGWLGYTVIKESISKTVEAKFLKLNEDLANRLDFAASYAAASSYVYITYNVWEEVEDIFWRDDPNALEQDPKLLKTTIEKISFASGLAKRGLDECYKNFYKLAIEERYKNGDELRVKCSLTNTFLYFSSILQRIDPKRLSDSDRKRMLKFAKDLELVTDPYYPIKLPSMHRAWYSWLETVSMARLTYGSDDEIKAALKMIADLCSDNFAAPRGDWDPPGEEWRKKTRERYKRLIDVDIKYLPDVS